VKGRELSWVEKAFSNFIDMLRHVFSIDPIDWRKLKLKNIVTKIIEIQVNIEPHIHNHFILTAHFIPDDI
jgi:hypothetical protein